MARDLSGFKPLYWFGAASGGAPVIVQAIKDRIALIPGEQGWWHSAGQTAFEGLAAYLAVRGLGEEEIMVVLDEAYGAVAGEFGG